MSEGWTQHQLAEEMPETVTFRGRSETDIQKRRDFLHSSQLWLERKSLRNKTASHPALQLGIFSHDVATETKVISPLY